MKDRIEYLTTIYGIIHLIITVYVIYNVLIKIDSSFINNIIINLF